MNKLTKISWKQLLLSLSALAVLGLVNSSCKDDLDLYEEPNVAVSPDFADNIIVFGQEGGSQQLSLKTNRHFTITLGEGADWVSVSPLKGAEGEHKITIEALPNQSDAREVEMVIKTSTKTYAYLISQKSVNGQDITYSTLAEVAKIGATAPREGKTIDQDLRIRATVTTHYQDGQFVFKGYHHIQDAEGNAIVLTIPKGEDPLEFGDQVTAKLKGCKISNYNGTIQVEVPHTNMTIVSGRPIDPIETTIEEILAGKHVNQYVRLKEVQFVKSGVPFFSGTYSSYRHKIQDKSGKEMQLDVWKSATFATETVPAESGTITGVATISTGSDGKTYYNLRPSLRRDIQLDQPHFTVSEGGGGKTEPDTPIDPKGNTYGVDLKQTPIASLSEDFANAGTDNGPITITNWLNKAIEGSRTFSKKSFTPKDGSAPTTHYAQASAFKSKDATNKMVLATPRLSMTSGTTYKLDVTYSTGHTNGAKLIIRQLDKDGAIVKTLFELVADDSPSAYGNQHYQKSFSVEGTAEAGYIAFVYEGKAPERTTTYQIEAVKFSK